MDLRLIQHAGWLRAYTLSEHVHKLKLLILFNEVLSNSNRVTSFLLPPQARASLAEWLKERSLVPHLLHGLFTVLSDSTSSPLNTHIEGESLVLFTDVL